MKHAPAAGLLLALVLAPAARAQFQLYLLDGGVEKAAPAVCDLGSIYSGESATARFRLRNTSNSAAPVNVLAVAGVGFVLTAPAVPIGLASLAFVDFSVAFHATDTGTYSASLRSEGISILLTATVAPRLTYRLTPASGADFPGPVDFGSVIVGASAQLRVAIQNDTSALLAIPPISLKGVGFALSAAAPSGQTLAPHQGAEFGMVFTPQVVGGYRGTLILGDRSYPLAGVGTDPPLPKPIVSLDLKQAASAQQGNLIVRFDAPARAGGTGIATLDFHGPADSAIAFAAGGRTTSFAIHPGDLQAVLPFQTGTSAGILTFSAQIADQIDQQFVTIAGMVPEVTTTQTARSSSSVEIRLSGFDNTRSLGALTFTFYDAGGNIIAPGAIRADATPQFTSFFAGSSLGGVFLLRAVFPITGDPAQVASCEVTLTNSAGSFKTQRIYF